MIPSLAWRSRQRSAVFSMPCRRASRPPRGTRASTPSSWTRTSGADSRRTSSASATVTRSSNNSPGPSMKDLFELPFEPVPSRRILSVTELTVGVRDLLETRFSEVWVEGELSNCKIWNTGHLYFTLKDPASQVRGVMFRSALRYLKFKPTDGLTVVARGRVSVYEPKGEYQRVCEHLEPRGLRAPPLGLAEAKKRPQGEGLFDASRKRPLPALPRKIGIVTSLEGAAIRDIITVLGRRYANVQIVIRPARVQGEGAALDIARGLRAIGRVPGVDVVL